MYFFVNLIILLQIVSHVMTNGFLEMRMVWYRNPRGKDYNNNRCDNNIFARSCDTIFTFCIDHSTGSDNPESCPIFKGLTGEFRNKNDVTFSGDMLGVRNPIKVDMFQWQGAIKFKVKVIDDDSSLGKVDLVDEFSDVLSWPASSGVRHSQWKELILIGRRAKDKTHLKILRKFYCAVNYYGTECIVKCVAENGPAHYTCDPGNGDRVCKPGYEGVKCVTLIDDCIGNRCENGATCVDKHLEYTCTCLKGFTGERCETDIDDCLSNSCANNSTCVDGVASYTCNCTHGYVGHLCKDHICQDVSPCKNGGTCYLNATSDEASCLCTDAYKGPNCTIDRCTDVKCYNNGTCTNGICKCGPGYIGSHCDQVYCKYIPCHHGSTCSVDRCICNMGYSGKYCEDEIDYCLSEPCMNEGTCIRHIGTFTCKCLPRYEGFVCEVEVPEVSTMVMPTQQFNRKTTTIGIDPIISHSCDRIPVWAILILCLQTLLIIIMLIAHLITKNRRYKKEIQIHRQECLSNRPVSFHRELSHPAENGITNPHYDETVRTPTDERTQPVITTDVTSNSHLTTAAALRPSQIDLTPPPYEEIDVATPRYDASPNSEHPYEECGGATGGAASNPLYDVNLTDHTDDDMMKKEDLGIENNAYEENVKDNDDEIKKKADDNIYSDI